MKSGIISLSAFLLFFSISFSYAKDSDFSALQGLDVEPLQQVEMKNVEGTANQFTSFNLSYLPIIFGTAGYSVRNFEGIVYGAGKTQPPPPPPPKGHDAKMFH